MVVETKPSYREAITKGVEGIDPSKGDPANIVGVEEVDETQPAKSEEGKTQTGEEELEPLLKDVDLSKFPNEESKQEFLRVRKEYDKAFHKKMAKLGEASKLQDQWETLTPEQQARVQAAVEGKEPPPKVTPSEVPKEVKTQIKRIDRWIDEAETPQARENLRDLKQVILELSDSEGLQKQVDLLTRAVRTILTEKTTSKAGTVDSDIDKLEERYSSSLIEKYRTEMKQEAKQYPNLTALRLLHRVADPDEIEEGRLPKKPVTKQGQRGTQPAPSVTTPQTQYDKSEKELTRGNEKARTWNIAEIIKRKRMAVS